MGKLDKIGQSEHWKGKLDRARTSYKNGPFPGPMVGNVSVPMFLKPETLFSPTLTKLTFMISILYGISQFHTDDDDDNKNQLDYEINQ
jgi:hypothetical protein